jgi:cellulose synthase (UDP-forming)
MVNKKTLIELFESRVEHSTCEKKYIGKYNIQWPTIKFNSDYNQVHGYDIEKITISDDGKSEEVRMYVETVKENNLEINIIYKNRITINGHSKAGNINDTIYSTEITTEHSLILILDSDMQCEKNILKKLVPYFYYKDKRNIVFNEKMAFVQSHQSFTNIEKCDILGQRYIYFYHIIMKSWALWNCTPCCGTNVLFNRHALEKIGGFQYGSVTEDFLTSMYLHSKGYTSKYCNETLATGLAPYYLDDFYKQRFRWSLGGIQLLKYIPKVCGKLSLVQYWIYFNSAVFTMCTPFFILLVCSILIICYVPNQIFGDVWYTYYFTPFIITHIIILLFLFQPVSYLYLFRSYQESVFMLNCNFVVFIYTILNLPYSFRITPKTKKNKFLFNMFWCVPYLTYYAFAIYTIFVAKKQISIPGLFWLSTICIQMFPPIRYALKFK